MSKRCVCVGANDAEGQMLIAMGMAPKQKKSCMALLNRNGGGFCSREKGHSGPHVACVWHGYESGVNVHNITRVRGI